MRIAFFWRLLVVGGPLTERTREDIIPRVEAGCMGTKVVRLEEEDVERVNQLSGIDARMPFAEKVRAALRRLEGRGLDLDDVRIVVREELERLAGGR